MVVCRMVEFRKRYIHGLQTGLGVFTVPLLMLGGYLLADNLHVFQPNQVVSARQINANFQKMAPVGGIIAWHKSLSGTPALSPDWVECNGQTINDAESPFNGRAAPNLNNPPQSWNGKGVFLRGHISSGIFENDQFQGHGHSITPNPHNHSVFRFIANTLFAGAGGVTNSGDTGNLANPDPYIGINGTSLTVGNASASSFGAARNGSETRSTNMSVVWIMRIK